MVSNHVLKILVGLAAWITACHGSFAWQAESPHFASGIKVGEVTQSSAIVWVRTTKDTTADFGQLEVFTRGLESHEHPAISMPADVVPGVQGRVRVVYGTQDSDAVETDWVTTVADQDFTHQFRLKGLLPGTPYWFRVQATGVRSDSEPSQVSGRFSTAPATDQAQPIEFIVSTCQAIRSIDSGADGHVAYEQMLGLAPDFFVHTGDIVYYDKIPLCKSVPQARAKWNLMFAYGHNRRFHQNVPSYFMKDDHDTLKNDCWPGQRYGELTFEQGLSLFREQVCMGDSTYRTVRWGKDVQIWMTENRDFRSSNRAPDGPEKTILGEVQKSWLMKTISESDATYKFVITPGPIVGPDKKGKADNHSNAAFAHEGQQLRDFLSQQTNTFVICGDRHWQYCSKDPRTGLLEMGCGPINDQHDFGGDPGENPKFHRYFSPKGGFLRIRVDGEQAVAEWFHAGETDPNSGLPKVLFSMDL